MTGGKFTKTQDIVLSALLIALVYISTRFINIRLPISINGGLIHFGTAMLFISAIVFGGQKAALAGAFGMALFDITSDWAAWAPFTFVIRGAMGYTAGYAAYINGKKGGSMLYNIVGALLGGMLMIAGYYFTEAVLYGNWIAPVKSIPGNLIQIVSGIIIALPISAALKRARL